MSTADWKKAAGVFDRALQLEDGPREAYLSGVQREDPDLGRRVRQLLDQDLSTSGPEPDSGWDGLHRRARQVMDDQVIQSSIGGYRMLRRLGRGGMGTVYLAEDPGGLRRVAVKVLQPGLDPDRFEQERRILARMEHPSIARFIGSGSTGDGRLYVVMEYAPGASLICHCAQRQLGLEERLRIFLDLCEAVEYAHGHLILHRDIKPGNILVSESGCLKLLDFGIAKLMDTHPDIGSGVHTGSLVRVLTPRYASPEQFSGESLSTASDVYSLGVVLHELLTGQRPFHAFEDRPRELEHAVLTRAPGLPSRITGEGAFQRLLRGDLDTILLKALATDRSRRYATVSALAGDLRRYLDRRPIEARPISVWYQARKFVQRNSALAASLASIVILVLAFSVTAFQQSQQLREQRDAAEREKQRSQAVTQVLIQAFDQAQPGQGSRADRSAREILQNSVRFVDEHLADRPLALFEMKRVMGEILQQVDLRDQAKTQFQEALALARQHGTAPPGMVVEVLVLLAEAALARDRLDETAHYLGMARAQQAGTLAPALVTRLDLLDAHLLMPLQPAHAYGLFLQIAAAPAADLPAPLLVRSLTLAAAAAGRADSPDLGIRLYERAFELEMDLPVRSRHWIDLVAGLAGARVHQGEVREAMYLYTTGLVTARSRYGSGSREESAILAGLGQLHLLQGNHDHAITYFARSLGNAMPAGTGTPDQQAQRAREMAAKARHSGLLPRLAQTSSP